MIKDSDRKILWTKAGNRCSICVQTLTLNTESGKNLVLGEEAHIISRQVNGPRYQILEEYDSYDNLILLCPNHHATVDKDEKAYSVEKLKDFKKKHEERIETSTNPKEEHSKWTVYTNKDFPLHTILTGSELIDIVYGSYSLSISNDEPNTIEESELISYFLGEIEDWDMLPELPLSERPNIQLRVTHLINKLFQNGFFVIGAKENAKVKFHDSTEPWTIAHIGIVRIVGSKVAKVIDTKGEA
jgi:hypothetical protein